MLRRAFPPSTPAQPSRCCSTVAFRAAKESKSVRSHCLMWKQLYLQKQLPLSNIYASVLFPVAVSGMPLTYRAPNNKAISRLRSANPFAWQWAPTQKVLEAQYPSQNSIRSSEFVCQASVTSLSNLCQTFNGKRVGSFDDRKNCDRFALDERITRAENSP